MNWNEVISAGKGTEGPETHKHNWDKSLFEAILCNN